VTPRHVARGNISILDIQMYAPSQTLEKQKEADQKIGPRRLKDKELMASVVPYS
jgi:hypothetical protein